MTPTIATACADLKLDPLIVVYPGTRRYEVVRKVLVRSLPDAVDELK